MARLLIICQGYPPYYGGAEHAAAALAEQAAGTPGLTVHVVTSDIGGRLDAKETLNGVHVTRLPCRKRAWGRHTVPELLRFYMAAAGQLDALHAELKPDYIIAVFTMPAGLVARRWAKRHAVPYTVVLQGSDVPGYQPDRFAPLHPAMRIVARSVWSAARHVVAVSTPLAHLARKTWPDATITVIPNGVDTRLFKPSAEHTDGERVRIVALSQLIPRKGIQYLIHAVGGMSVADRERCAVDIYGSGPHQAALETQSREAGLTESVAFHGLLDRSKVADALRAAQIFVHPSTQEGLPLAVLEAMSTGLAVIVTPVGDVPKVVRDGVTGRLVPARDIGALRDALAELVGDVEQRRRLGLEARAAALSYDWSSIWNQHRRLAMPPLVQIAPTGDTA